jgi:hypothetical protein
MSNHAGRLQPKRSIYFGFERGDLAALILGLVIGLALLIAHPWYGDSHSSWPSVSGHVLETRIVVVHLLEHQYIPSEILYQVQGHITYERDGKQYNSWLPVSKQSTDKGFLEFWLSQKKSKVCTVRWPPKNPSSIEAVLY